MNERLEVEGKVIKSLPNTKFKVEISNENNEHKHVVTAYLSGRLRKNCITIIEGDLVSVELSPYDLSQGRIIYRSKK